MTTSSIQFRVRYADTDAQGIVYHANYLVWFEQGRTELLRAAGMPYSELEKLGYLIVVAKAEVKYHLPAVYDDLIRLETRIVGHKGAMVEFAYEVYNQRDELLVTGQTTHVVLNSQRRPNRMPAPLKAALDRVSIGVDKAEST